MRRIPLWLASAAVAAASCLAVLYALREPSGPDRVSVSEPGAAQRLAPVAAAAPIAAAPAPAADPSRRLEQAAGAAVADEQARRDAIFGIAEAEGLPLDTRLERYREALQAAQDGSPGMQLAHAGVWVEAFLRAEAVQQELAALGPAARRRELAHIRRELGVGEDELARLEELDARREARWQNGLEYMQERERVVATFEGEVQEQELEHLRERYFANEAPTIEREERDGFFRFERPRVYGRN